VIEGELEVTLYDAVARQRTTDVTGLPVMTKFVAKAGDTYTIPGGVAHTQLNKGSDAVALWCICISYEAL
jgi:uncharacterized RmlC-like cupin family protein